MAKKNERIQEIMRLLEINSVLTVNELSRLLDVSHMTVRRDLKTLEAENIVSLIHGGAALSPCYQRMENPGEYELPAAKSAYIHEKLRIGGKASELPARGDTIILDTGSTTECVARALPAGSELTVICFALNVLMQVYKKGNTKILFAGGRFHEKTLMFECPEGLELIRRHRATYGFISASGIDAKLGITCATRYETATKQAVLASCKTRVLVADSSKFDSVGPSHFADFTDFEIVITDRDIPKEYRQLFEEKGIQLIVV